METSSWVLKKVMAHSQEGEGRLVITQERTWVKRSRGGRALYLATSSVSLSLFYTLFIISLYGFSRISPGIYSRLVKLQRRGAHTRLKTMWREREREREREEGNNVYFSRALPGVHRKSLASV